MLEDFLDAIIEIIESHDLQELIECKKDITNKNESTAATNADIID